MKRLLVASLLLAVTPAAAAPPRLQITRDPKRPSLRMRRAAQAPGPTPAPAAARARGTHMPSAPDASPVPPRSPPAAAGASLDGVRDVRQAVSVTVNVGYQLDGARPSGQATLGGPPPTAGDFATLRSYGFGEGFASTRGVGIASLSTYFSARFQVVRKLSFTDPNVPGALPVGLPPPIATWFDRSGTEIRTGWAEVKDFLPRHWGLRKLRVRVGDQYVYGPWNVHLVGMNVAWDGPAFSAQGFFGPRRSSYNRARDNEQPQATGGSLRFDFRGLSRPLPIAISASHLLLTESDDTGQPQTRSTLYQADWRPRETVAVIGQVRTLDGKVANQRLEVRARYKEVTNVVLDVMRRLEDDWRWDPTLVVRRQDDITEARRYLDLGPVLPQLVGSLRGGTLIAENVDLLARVGGALDLRDETTPANTFTQSYFEVAGALEVRLRRQAALGLSALTRQTKRSIIDPIEDVAGTAQMLPPSGATGDSGFTELGTRLRMTLGARKFSAVLEIYGRRTHYEATYVDPLAPVPLRDLRGGGRVTIDAWLGPRVRLYAQYDASSELDSAPEINGYRSLRLIASGVY